MEALKPMHTLKENVSPAPALPEGDNGEVMLRPIVERPLLPSHLCRKREVFASRWVLLRRALVFLCTTLGMLVSLLFLASKRQSMGETLLETLRSLMRHDLLHPL